MVTHPPSTKKKGIDTAPIFGPCLLLLNSRVDDRPRPRLQCVRWGPCSPKMGHITPHFSSQVYRGQTAGCIKIPIMWLYFFQKKFLSFECGPTPNMMAAQPIVGGTVCENPVIPFLAPRHKVWLTAAARVPCSNATRRTQDLDAKGTLRLAKYRWGQETPKMYI